MGTRPIRLFVESAAAAAVFLASAAQGTITIYTANLNGSSKSPPNASPGMGTAIVTIDDVANTMGVQVTFSGLLRTSPRHRISAPLLHEHFHGTAGVATTTPTLLASRSV